jgi:hypothetical protein
MKITRVTVHIYYIEGGKNTVVEVQVEVERDISIKQLKDAIRTKRGIPSNEQFELSLSQEDVNYLDNSHMLKTYLQFTKETKFFLTQLKPSNPNSTISFTGSRLTDKEIDQVKISKPIVGNIDLFTNVYESHLQHYLVLMLVDYDREKGMKYKEILEEKYMIRVLHCDTCDLAFKQILALDKNYPHKVLRVHCNRSLKDKNGREFVQGFASFDQSSAVDYKFKSFNGGMIDYDDAFCKFYPEYLSLDKDYFDFSDAGLYTNEKKKSDKVRCLTLKKEIQLELLDPVRKEFRLQHIDFTNVSRCTLPKSLNQRNQLGLPVNIN